MACTLSTWEPMRSFIHSSTRHLLCAHSCVHRAAPGAPRTARPSGPQPRGSTRALLESAANQHRSRRYGRTSGGRRRRRASANGRPSRPGPEPSRPGAQPRAPTPSPRPRPARTSAGPSPARRRHPPLNRRAVSTPQPRSCPAPAPRAAAHAPPTPLTIGYPERLGPSAPCHWLRRLPLILRPHLSHRHGKIVSSC